MINNHFPNRSHFKGPTSPQCLEYIIQYLIKLSDDESMPERHEAVVLHGCTFCMSLQNNLLEANLHLKMSSCCTYSCITSSHTLIVHHWVLQIYVKNEISTKMIKCHFHNCHYRNGIGCDKDTEPSNNRIISFFLRELQCIMHTGMIISIPIVVYCPRPIIWTLILL